MSTVDPNPARLPRESRRPSTGAVAAFLIVLVASGVATGWGWTLLALIDSAGNPPLVAVPAVILGMLVAILGLIAWGAVVRRRSDVGVAYALSAVVSGGGAGVLVAVSSTGWPPVPAVVGVGLVVLGVLLLAVGLAAAAARRTRVARDEEVMRTGTVATATVTDKGYDVFRESSRILTTVTFTFRDLRGVQRWVQKPMVIDAASPVAEGDESRLWYDAAEPGNVSRIVVDLARRNALRP